MHEIEKWIEQAAEHLKISLRKLPKAEALNIQRQAMSRYVAISDPRVWWLNLARPIDEYYDRHSVSLLSILPQKTGTCWILPEIGGGWLPVYEIEVEQIESLIYECPGFEYNLVAKDFTWLVIETDHDQYYVCRDSDELQSVRVEQ